MNNTVSLDGWLGLPESNHTIAITTEPEAKKIGGQTVAIHGCYCYVWIREGPWITAGREFSWKRKEPGFSVNKSIVEFADTHDLSIRIINGGNHTRCYEIAVTHLIEFVNETDSITEKYGATLYVVPWSRCRTVHDDITAIIHVLGDA